MNQEKLYSLFTQVSSGNLSPDGALKLVQAESYVDLGFAKVDHGRQQRLGFPEVVYSEHKTSEQLEQICLAHLEVHDCLLLTRLAEEKYLQLKEKGIGGCYNPIARTLSFAPSSLESVGSVLILSAGTSDLYVAEEAKETAQIMGNNVKLITDIGVAGLHRLLDRLERLRQAKVVIVVAGMEGALASVVGGLVQVPIIAVPTSVGYGASFQGIAALLSMLNSCAPGVTVVNIDNGFGAGFAASLINNPTAESS
ncbi:MAG: nickel pincer cofactor biosynthesis protein LarB [SAR324 cluster bacterium]|nr:nickel pincer cofactor biosynthesis protein LarB [SAR324 cluster bacterium]